MYVNDTSDNYVAILQQILLVEERYKLGCKVLTILRAFGSPYRNVQGAVRVHERQPIEHFFQFPCCQNTNTGRWKRSFLNTFVTIVLHIILSLVFSK